MTAAPLPDKTHSYTGEELPQAVRLLIAMRKLSSAMQVMHQQVYSDRAEVMEAIQSTGDDPSLLPERLAAVPLYEKIGEVISVQEDDSLYRMTSDQLYHRAGDCIAHAMMCLTTGMWVEEGAKIPDGLMELVKTIDG